MGAWLTALERFGTMTVAEVFEPAIELPANGFRVHSVLNTSLNDPTTIEGLHKWPSLAEVFMRDGKPLAIGELCVQPDLARTLEKLVAAAAGAPTREAGIAAARDRFYGGDIARAMIDFSESEGGWLSMEDLDAFEATTYRSATVYACGPWCQGPAVLQTLNILEGYDMAGMELGSVDYYHVILEPLKAFADRDRYYGDPRFVDVPMEGLLSKAYAAAWRDRIDMAKATAGMPEPGDAWAFQNGKADDAYPMPKEGTGPLEPDTSYLCVVDSEGNAFSATPGDGARETPIVPGFGFIISSVLGSIFTQYKSSALVKLDWSRTFTPALLRKDVDFGLEAGTTSACRCR
jgi:gamma-glutamyltranspeptidase/glutathione hydrolase